MFNEDNVKILKALGEESRYRIVQVLMSGEKCACEIPDLIGRTQSNTSMHLTKLSYMGILSSRKDGKQVIYAIKNKKVCDIFKALGYNTKSKNCSCCSPAKIRV